MSKDSLQKALLGLISAGGFAGISIFLGRIWTQAYYSVFGLPTSDIQFSVADYAFQSKEMLLMLVVAAAAAGWLSYSTENHRLHLRNSFVQDKDRLTRGGRFLLGLGLALTISTVAVAHSKPERLDGLDRFFGIVGIWGGIGAGLTLRILAEVLLEPDGTTGATSTGPGESPPSRPKQGNWLVSRLENASESVGRALSKLWKWAVGRARMCRRGAAGVLIVAILLAGLPWMTGQFGEYDALRALRNHRLPQVVLEFEPEKAPQAIRRSDTSNVSELVNLVLATDKRIAVLYPFGCTSIGLASRAGPPKGASTGSDVDGGPAANSEVCDVVTFDRASVLMVRVFAKGSDRPPNDDRSRPDIVTLPSLEPYNQQIDLSGARGSDACGGYTTDDGQPGVWYRIEPKQSGSLRLDHRPDRVLISPVDLPADCDQFADSPVTFDDTQTVRVNAGDKLLVLVAARKGKNDHLVKQLSLDFSPLQFRPTDCLVLTSCDKSQTTISEKGKTWRSTNPWRSPFFVEAGNTQIVVTIRGEKSVLDTITGACQNSQSPSNIRVSLTPEGPGGGTSAPAVSLCPDRTGADTSGALVLTTNTRLSRGKWVIQIEGVTEKRLVESWQVTLTVPPPAGPTPTPAAAPVAATAASQSR